MVLLTIDYNSAVQFLGLLWVKWPPPRADIDLTGNADLFRFNLRLWRTRIITLSM
jgi:hypothetical protein